MDRHKAISRSLLATGRAALCTSILFASAVSATAAQLEQHNDLVNTYVTTMHADPLVADCAAHGNFVASTSNVIDHVEFTPQSFDCSHATVTPWNDSFDERKQRVKVDTVVSVSGIGVPQNGNDSPRDLTFRCGYVDNQMLAFSWNDPSPGQRAHGESSRDATRVGTSSHGGHAVGKGKGKGRGKESTKAGKGVKKNEHGSPAGNAQGHTAKKSTKSSAKKTAKKKSSK